MAIVQQLIDILLVDLTTLALAIRTVVAAEAHALVELDTQPSQGLDDIVFRPGNEALGIRILDTENHITAILFSE